MPYIKGGEKLYQQVPSFFTLSHLYVDVILPYLWIYVSFVVSRVACPSLIDVVVVCDESNSIYPWDAVKNFLEKFVQGLDIGPTKTQVWTSIIYTLTHGFRSEKILLEMRSLSLHLSNPHIKGF